MTKSKRTERRTWSTIAMSVIMKENYILSRPNYGLKGKVVTFVPIDMLRKKDCLLRYERRLVRLICKNRSG